MKISCKIYSGILLMGALVFYSSCAEPFPELPAATQTGAGTFGCLVNNELVFAESSSSKSGLEVGAIYSRNTDQLQVSALCQFKQQFVFVINNPYNKQDTDIQIDTLRYLPPNSDEWTEAAQTGNFHITRIDSAQGIVSGVFSFDLNINGNAPVLVTEGRFDLQLSSPYY